MTQTNHITEHTFQPPFAWIQYNILSVVCNLMDYIISYSSFLFCVEVVKYKATAQKHSFRNQCIYPSPFISLVLCCFVLIKPVYEWRPHCWNATMVSYKQLTSFRKQLLPIKEGKEHIWFHNLLKCKTKKPWLQLLANNVGNKYSKLLLCVRQYSHVNWSNRIRIHTPSGNNSFHSPPPFFFFFLKTEVVLSHK